jgi:hypothetical protein
VNLRIESAAGFQSGSFEAGNASAKNLQYAKPSDAANIEADNARSVAPPSPQRVNAVAEKAVENYPRLVGPEAPRSLLFEASLAVSAKKRSDGESNGAHIDFPRMINRRWVPSPAQLRLIEETK